MDISGRSGSPAARSGGALLGWARVIGDRSQVEVTPEVQVRIDAVIAKYGVRTKDRPEEVAEWVRRNAKDYRPAGEDDAATVCKRLASYGQWLWDHGYDLDASVAELLSPAMVDSFINVKDWSPSTVTTARSLYNRVRRQIAGEVRVMVAGHRPDLDSATKPFSAREVARLVRFVESLVSNPRQHNAAAAFLGLSLGAGAMLQDCDGIAVDGWDSVGAKAVRVELGGPNARIVTVRGKWARHLLDVKDRVGSGSPFGTEEMPRTARQAAKSLETLHARRVAGLTDAQRARAVLRLDFDRGRTTWMVERIGQSPRLDVLLAEAGVGSAATLVRYLQFLKPLGDAAGGTS